MAAMTGPGIKAIKAGSHTFIGAGLMTRRL